ncbi:DnaJ domain protein [Aquisphaera giovannonii]|uniref:DnaJ domain protein n=1 Tax=Aquisphaera giovannonii TaxID=406548 RepID=A0A5B9WD85_9BACT|nr:DnaJ domain-containing protein [Aquisphaera giovannonii]QEH38542.1 DnaJ domain protein [Aquisphaera giovannonii]
MVQDEDAAYACCSIGIGRWYWAAWGSEEDARALARPFASGYEKNSDAAEKKAIEAAGAGAKRLPAKWASAYKRGGPASDGEGAEKREKPRSRLSRPAGTAARPAAPDRPRFLYAASESDEAGSRGEVVIVKHRIVRQTAGKIYVDREPFREEEWRGREGADPSAEAPKPKTLAVDRETLRREGRFPHRGAAFYSSEEAGIRDVHAALTSRHAWCAALGVKFPCSAASIKAAYRRLARETHPDAGGDPVQFQAVERAYREALAYFSSPDDPAGLGA